MIVSMSETLSNCITVRSSAVIGWAKTTKLKHIGKLVYVFYKPSQLQTMTGKLHDRLLMDAMHTCWSCFNQFRLCAIYAPEIQLVISLAYPMHVSKLSLCEMCSHSNCPSWLTAASYELCCYPWLDNSQHNVLLWHYLIAQAHPMMLKHLPSCLHHFL